MIIGNGDIGTVLKEVDRHDLLFFASGVSNSKEDRETEYQREKDLLLSQLLTSPTRDLRLVYFSTLAIFYSKTRYTEHKLYMEDLIKTGFKKYTIIRLGNITWGNNPHTIINFLKNRINQGLPIEIQDVYRYIIDQDEFLHWMKKIPDFNCEMNITGTMMKVKELVIKYCQEEVDKKIYGYA